MIAVDLHLARRTDGGRPTANEGNLARWRRGRGQEATTTATAPATVDPTACDIRIRGRKTPPFPLALLLAQTNHPPSPTRPVPAPPSWRLLKTPGSGVGGQRRPVVTIVHVESPAASSSITTLGVGEQGEISSFLLLRSSWSVRGTAESRSSGLVAHANSGVHREVESRPRRLGRRVVVGRRLGRYPHACARTTLVANPLTTTDITVQHLNQRRPLGAARRSNLPTVVEFERRSTTTAFVLRRRRRRRIGSSSSGPQGANDHWRNPLRTSGSRPAQPNLLHLACR